MKLVVYFGKQAVSSMNARKILLVKMYLSMNIASKYAIMQYIKYKVRNMRVYEALINRESLYI